MGEQGQDSGVETEWVRWCRQDSAGWGGVETVQDSVGGRRHVGGWG